MNNEFEARRMQDEQPIDDTVSRVTNAIVTLITAPLVVIITVLVSVLVLIGGAWLLYALLPTNVFLIVAAVVLATTIVPYIVLYIYRRWPRTNA